MLYRTYSDLKNEVLRETDTEAEDFLQAEEIMDYFNDAVREGLSHIQKLGLEDDYFQKSVSYSLTLGQTELDLPTDIYAAKIRALIYSTPSKIYPIKRLKGKNKFLAIQELLQPASNNTYYSYDLENPSPTSGFKIKLYPVSYETTTNCIILNYVRTVERITGDSSLVDIPEFYSFIKAFVKMKIFDKENSDRTVKANADYEKEKLLMMETLGEMTPDYDNLIEGDTTIYEEHS